MDAPRGDSVGAALRAARRQRRLSLADVAARSGNEFKASSLGAYERGDRAISVHRLRRLAEVYGISPEALLNPSRPDVIDLVRIENQEHCGLVLDLSRFRTGSDPRSVAVMGLGAAVKAMRKESTSSVIVVRRTDAALLASLVGCDPADLERELEARSPDAATL